MKFANHAGRLCIVDGDRVLDVADASNGRFGSEPMAAFDDWPALLAWARDLDHSAVDPAAVDRAAVDRAAWRALDETSLGCPVPEPRQVFAIGLNYRTHAEESGMAIPSVPATFTKFPASLAGPFDDIVIHGDAVDWEVELVAVIGTRADRVPESEGWRHVAALTVGQDISDRTLQFAAGMQFSLGKSRAGYGPMGPWLVTPDEFADPDDLGLGCRVDGEVVQDARTDDLVFSVPRLVAELSAVLPLLPGDVIFTGTPAGVGMARTPPRGLRPGEVLETWVEGIGSMRNRCVG